jgi:hypothetical protein
MQKNGISLKVLNSFAESQKVLSLQDIFDYIAYNNESVVAMLLCSDKIKQAYFQYNDPVFEFYNDYKHDYINNVIKPAFNRAYPGLNLYSGSSDTFDAVSKSKSLHNAISVLGYGANNNFGNFDSKPILTKTSLDLNANGNIKLPDVTDNNDLNYHQTSTFFKMLTVDDTLFLIIKPAVFNNVGSDIDNVIFNNEWFSSCTDILDTEPTTIQENMFIRAVSVLSINGTDNDWANTALCKYYFRVFIIN